MTRPVDRRPVKVGQHTVQTYSCGDAEEVVFLLNGGPGLPCLYMQQALLPLADRGYRVVTYDQLGCGASDRPADAGLWTIDRYVEEVETVRVALDLGPVHLLGHSWGGWLGIDYALRFPGSLRSLILSNTSGDMPHMIGELNRLRAALGPETVAMMQRYEAEGRFDHPAYTAAITILTYRHVLRLDDWPAPVTVSLNDWNMEVYQTMQGPNEFHFTGNLKDWNRIPEMASLALPVLILCGQHDELTPACALRMKQALLQAELTVFPNSSHLPMWEEPASYLDRVAEFLAGVEAS